MCEVGIKMKSARAVAGDLFAAGHIDIAEALRRTTLMHDRDRVSETVHGIMGGGSVVKTTIALCYVDFPLFVDWESFPDEPRF